jgi:hypothetical protein
VDSIVICSKRLKLQEGKRMNRSITQKILLVILLVTLMDGGSLAESGARSANPGIIQKSGPLINGMTGAIADHLQPTFDDNCPGNRNLAHNNVPATASRSN